MRVWSRGLGKQSLYADWFKSDLKVEGRTLVAEGIVRDKGIIWDCKFFFEKEDVPGLLHMLFSGPVVKHFLKNFKYVLSFFYQRIIKRSAGKEKPKKDAVQATADTTATPEAK
jgi:hypothetical protein